eukprot:IDg19623t1
MRCSACAAPMHHAHMLKRSTCIAADYLNRFRPFVPVTGVFASTLVVCLLPMQFPYRRGVSDWPKFCACLGGAAAADNCAVRRGKA